LVESIAAARSFDLMGRTSELFPVATLEVLPQCFQSPPHFIDKHFDDLAEFGVDNQFGIKKR